MVKQRASKKKSKGVERRWFVSGIALFFLVCLIGFFTWFFYVGSTEEMEAVANQFKSDPSWELKTEAIYPPKTFCGDVECPSMSRQWNTPNLLTSDEFKQYLDRSGWEFSIEGDCIFDSPNHYGTSIEVCSASGVIDKYKVSMSVRTSNPLESHQIGLHISKER